MKQKIFVIAFSGLLFFNYGYPGYAQESIDESAAIPVKEIPSPVASGNTAAQEPDQLTFSLANNDIYSWEQSSKGKYIYFTISEEKNEELAHLTNTHLGEPLMINIENIVVFVPEITEIFNQKQGFVLQVQDHQRQELMIMLGRDKQETATTEIDIPAGSFAQKAEPVAAPPPEPKTAGLNQEREKERVQEFQDIRDSIPPSENTE